MPDIVQVGIGMDTSQMKSAMTEAAASIKERLAIIQADFERTNAAVKRTAATIADLESRAASAKVPEMGSQYTAQANQARAALDSLVQEQARLQESLIGTKAELGQVLARMNAAAGGAKNVYGAFGQAAIGARLMGVEMGGSGALAYGIGRMVGMSAGMAPLVAKMFPVIAGVAFLELLGQIGESLEKGINYLRGWDADAKKAFEESTRAAYEMESVMEKQAETLRGFGAIGKEGVAKIGVEMKANADNIKAAERNLKDYQDRLKSQEALHAAVKMGPMDYAGVLTGSTGPILRLAMGKERDQTETQINEIKKQLEGLRKHQAELGTESAKLDVDSKSEQVKNSFALANAQIEAERRSGLAVISERQKLVRERVTMEQLDVDQETAVLKDAADQKLNIELESINKRRALLVSEHQSTGRYVAPELVKLGEEEQGARIEHHSELDSIEANAYQTRMRKQKEAMSEQAEGMETPAGKPDTHAQLEFWNQIANDAERGGELYKFAMKNAIHAGNTAIKEELTQQAQDAKNEFEAMQIAHQVNASEEKSFWQQKIATAREGTPLYEEALRGITEATKRQTQEQRQASEEQLNNAIKLATLQLASTNTLAEQRVSRAKESAIAAASAEIEALNEWYAKMKAAYAAREKDILTYYNRESQEYKNLQDRKSQLDLEYQNKLHTLQEKELQDFRNYFNQVTNSMFSGVNQWILGQKRFSYAMAEVWNGIVKDTLLAIEKIAAKWIVEHLLMAAASKIFMSGNAAGGAGDAAIVAAKNTAMAQSNIAEAATAALAWGTTEGGPPVGIAEATTVESIGQGFASAAPFAEGSLNIANTGLAILHKGEAVVPARSAEPFRADIGSAANGGSAKPTYIGDTHVHIHANMVDKNWWNGNQDNIVSSLRSAVRTGRLGRSSSWGLGRG